jgi:hypothetical protein
LKVIIFIIDTLKLCEKLNEESNKKLEEKMAISYLSTEPNREKSVGRTLIKNGTSANIRQKSVPKEKEKSMARNKTQLNITNDSNRIGVETKTPKPLARNATALNLTKTPNKTPSKANLNSEKGESIFLFIRNT